MSVKVYGIKNCNTMKKTFDYLDSKGVDYEFIDYKKQKPSYDLLNKFLEKTELGQLVNKKGMTYRKMDEQQRKDLEQKETAVPILAENSSMIKRPIILYPDTSLTLGFDEELISEKL